MTTMSSDRLSTGQIQTLRVDNLSVNYGNVRALVDVSFELSPGEFMGVLGANGAGKSTLLKTISGLVRPVAGTITYGDAVLSQSSPAHDVPTLGIAHVPERRRVFPSLTVLDNLVLGAYSKRARPQREEAIEEVYALFPKLKDRRTQLAGSLSGGEQQMLAVGRALMLRPTLLMLDEPSLGLAPVIVEEMFARIAQIHDELKISVLLIEQNSAQALEVVERGIVLSTGHVTFAGSTSELRESDYLRKAYLGL